MYLSEQLREFVATRAIFRCEYCLVHEEDMFWRYHLDHIISIKHGGNSDDSNLAYSCSICNQNKGTNLGTLLPPSKRLIRLFNPRIDKWNSHFEIDRNGFINSKSKIGEATIKVLDLNSADRIILRQELIKENRYP